MTDAEKRLYEVAKGVSEVVGFPPLKYLKGYARGSAVMWELRQTGLDQHPVVRQSIEGRLKTLGLGAGSYELNFEMKGKTTRIFLFLIGIVTSKDEVNKYARLPGRTFGRRRP